MDLSIFVDVHPPSDVWFAHHEGMPVAEQPARVGVVVRTKNRPWFLSRAIADIAAQSDDRWQARIVNDGGDRAAVDDLIVSQAPALRARLTAVHLPETRGRAAAANAGVEGLDTEFIVLHDDDDLWHPDFLSRTIGWLDEHPGDAGAVVRTDIVYEKAQGDGYVEVGREPMWPGLAEIRYTDLLRINRAVPISHLYRRSLHDDIGGYREDLDVVEDWEFNLRATLHHHLGFIDGEPLAFWMQRAGVGGDLGNSVVALLGEHSRFDALVRDEALRAWVLENGDGLPLFFTKYIEDEVARQLDLRRTLGQRLAGAVREWRRGRRMR